MRSSTETVFAEEILRMTSYSARNAENFWTKRVEGTDELSAVLSYNLPPEINEAYSRWEIQVVLQCLQPLRGKRVLDLACGVGRVTVPLAHQGAHVTSADNSQEMLNRCQKNVAEAGLTSGVTWEKVDATALSFPDGSFDVVTCLGLLEHLPPEPRQKTMGQIARVTGLGGTVVLVVNNNASAFLRKEERYEIDQQREDGYFCGIVDKETISQTLAGAGFRCRYAGSNAFQAIAKHLLRHYLTRDSGNPALQALFQLCGALDLQFPNKGDLDTAFADQFILEARRG
jgi:ubiquinone/menaquinone biosynthesis C-methylase UbiE